MMSVQLTPTASSNPRAAMPSVQDLEDTLYDILAAGVDPMAAPGTLEAVQVLLHEHARAPKSQAELLAFFENRGLSTSRGAVPIDASFALPTIELPDVEAGPAAIGGMQIDPSELSTRMPVRHSRGALPWAIGAAAAVLVGLGAGFGYVAWQSLRGELEGMRAQSAVQQQALAHVRAEAQTLRAAVTETSSLAERAEQKSELLLQTYASPLNPAGR
jgi:hypothetical protein